MFWQTNVLNVQINCLGCRKKVKKLLKKIEGVYHVSMDVEEQKVTVSGNVNAKIVIMRLLKSGKRAELLSLQELANQEKGPETQFRNPSPMTVSPYMQRMHLIEHMDNVYMHQPRSMMNRKFDMVPPISYCQNMNSYYI
nr:Heavy metal-associated isoprenylated plant protein 37 [Ipomoea batatas]